MAVSTGSGAAGSNPAPEVVNLDQSLWQAFSTARNDRAFVASWLSLLIARMPQASLGVVLEADRAAGAFVPVAIVPDPRRDLTGIREIAEKALASGRPATVPDEAGHVTRLAFPVRAGAEGPVEAVVVVEMQAPAPRAVQAGLRDMHWASGWLAARLWERRAGDESARVARAAVALDLLALAGEHRRPEAAAMAIVNELQTVLACDQVSMGMLKGARTRPRIRLLAMSYSAWFKRRSKLAERIEALMEECFDQGASVSAPPMPALSRAIAVAHGDHLRAGPTTHILSVPMHHEGGVVGVISFERRQDRPFAEEDRLIAESVAALIGPVMELKRRNRRWFGGRLIDGTVHVLGILLGARHLSWKLLALALALMGVAAATVQGPFRLQAEAVLRGAEQRAVVAPFAGFIAAGGLRAGDTVQAGDEIARLDDTDLALEDLRWRSEVDRLTSQQRTAQAQYDRGLVTLLDAQIAQARAQLRLNQGQLARTRLLAPIDGMIVSGDLSQRLGAPVQLGEVLFEIAPLDDYRVDIFLDERDLRFAREGMAGTLSLTGAPGAALPFEITRLTPVAEVREGLNTFRAEARLDAAPAGLRPGMEGVARIEAGRALVVWTWSRRLIDWARQTAWTWQP